MLVNFIGMLVTVTVGHLHPNQPSVCVCLVHTDVG